MPENESVDSKDIKSEQESENSNARDKDQKGSRNDNFRRNRGSHRNDKFGRKPLKRNWSDLQTDGQRKKMEVGSRLRECDVGITEFIGEKGFFGIIKERYTDFHVNEIALDGQIAKLTNQIIPPDVEENDSLELSKNMVSDEIWDQLLKLKESELSSIEIDVTGLDKEQRKAIHSTANKMANVVSQTITKENKKMMVIVRNKRDNSISHYFPRDNRVDWRKRGGEYCYFVLHKVNMDTMDALNQLAMNTRMKSNYFTYAGTKDRRAWTTQWVSVKRVEPLDILRAAKNVRGAYVGNFKFVKEPLKLGMLNGNRFRIALRNANGTDDQIEETMVSLRDNGFINYYGLQRFGTIAAIPTHAIGRALLQGKWDEAIELILKPRDGEQDRDLAEARKIYESTKDAQAAYKKMKRRDKIEAILLKGISTSGSTNPQGALDSIPRNIRLMYIHSYQSYVWNYMVSKRIKEFGRKPIVGDLVYEDDIKKNDNDTEDFIYDNDSEVTIKDNSEPSEKISKFESEVSTDIPKVKEEPTVHTESTITATKKSTDIEDLRTLPIVKILKENDLPNYTLADVLMPQVGWKVVYPPYAKPWFDEFLAKDGLTRDLRQKNKKYSLGGAYRKMLQVPWDVSWKIVHYKEKHSDLIMCDIDEMRNSTPPKDEPEGQYKALIVEMSLKASTYATMALREILKCDTSPEAQAAQFAACVTEAERSDTSEDVTESENACSQNIDNKNVDDERGSTVQEMESNDSEKTETGEQDVKMDVSDAM